MKCDNISPGLVHAGPVPGLASRHVVLADVDHLLACPDLPLRSIEDDADLVFAVQKLNVVKDITRTCGGAGKCQQLAVAIKLGLPPGGQIAFEPRLVERGRVEERTVGDDRASPTGS